MLLTCGAIGSVGSHSEVRDTSEDEQEDEDALEPFVAGEFGWCSCLVVWMLSMVDDVRIYVALASCFETG